MSTKLNVCCTHNATQNRQKHARCARVRLCIGEYQYTFGFRPLQRVRICMTTTINNVDHTANGLANATSRHTNEATWRTRDWCWSRRTLMLTMMMMMTMLTKSNCQVNALIITTRIDRFRSLTTTRDDYHIFPLCVVAHSVPFLRCCCRSICFLLSLVLCVVIFFAFSFFFSQVYDYPLCR